MLNLYPLRRPGKRPIAVLNIAHRGARAFAPENTLAAFTKAKTFGCRMFELDVRLSLDGELMVHHDDQLLRCTDVQAKFPDRNRYDIWDFTCDELSRLDAGRWYIAQLLLPGPQRQAFLQTLTDDELARFVSPKERQFYASGKIKLPTLKQALAFAGRADMMVNIELKTQPGDDKMAEAVVQLVEAMRMTQRVLISSFDHRQLALVRRLSDCIATGVLTAERLAHPHDYLQALDADAYHPHCYDAEAGTLNLDDIAATRAAGRTVNVWTCNNQDDMRKLIAAGVTGLISDYPNRVQQVLSAR